MAFRGIDVLDVYRGSLSLRRLRILIEHLPPESVTKTAIRRDLTPEQIEAARSNTDHRPDLAPWSNIEMLTASLLDAVRLNTASMIAVNGGPQPHVDPTPRPGIPPKKTGRNRLTDEQRRAIDPRMRNTPREA